MAKSKNVFKCEKCSDTKAMGQKKFMEHLIGVHKIVPNETKFSKQMICHMDGDTWFS